MARAWLLAGLVLLAACGARDHSDREAGSRGAGAPLDLLSGGAPEPGFARALAVRPFEFPLDHGPHPAYREEWWYFTGHLRAPSGARFGFELTFFRVGVAPPAAAEASPGSRDAGAGAARTPEAQSSWRARQFYVAHFAITDAGRGAFHSTQRFARDALGLAGARATPFRVWLGGWSVAADAPGVWSLRAADPAYALSLELRPLSPPVLNGDRGLSVKSDAPGSASYYYSIPRLQARGRLARAEDAMQVSGTAWLDREWGGGSLGPHEQGWDWFGLQLDDGSALLFYALRDLDGSRDPHSAGTWIAPDGGTRALSSADVRVDVLDHWVSPRGGVYPSRWRLRVSSLALDIEATPVLADQELDTTPRYWEGETRVAGMRDGRAVTGQGYVELVGYAQP